MKGRAEEERGGQSEAGSRGEVSPLGQAIVRLVELKSLSLDELAKRSGVHRRTVRNLIYGRHEPKPDTVRRIAEGLDVPVEVLTHHQAGTRQAATFSDCPAGRVSVGSAAADLEHTYAQEQVVSFGNTRAMHVLVHEGAAREAACSFDLQRDPLGRFRRHRCGEQNMSKDEAGEILDAVRALHPTWKPYNDPGLRLEAVAPSELGRLHFTFSITSYFDYVIQNLAVAENLVIDGATVRSRLEPGPQLSPLDTSPCGNITGVSCLLVTSDGWLAICERSLDVLTFPGLLGPSASGAMNFPDEVLADRPSVSIFDKIRLELREELGLPSNRIEDLLYLGTTRDLAFCGKPEVFFLAGTSLARRDLVDSMRFARDAHEVDRVVFVRAPSRMDQSWLAGEGGILVGPRACSSLRANTILFARQFNNLGDK